ncbi:MAG: cytochrome c-type biogenesis protein CcmH, partial [Magnetococcales bacterium]|nr:cytochrome c-type biogenesis protein CcmH [Magnetococcales bacterium]
MMIGKRFRKSGVQWMLVVVVLLLVPMISSAEQRVEDPTEARVREIARNLRCAVCQN